MDLLKEKFFESVFISDRVDRDYTVRKTLSDEDYIGYHIWLYINIHEMYRKHKPNARLRVGVNPNIIFHGGCLGCLSQRKHGINRCTGCQYFRADWSKNNLHIEGEEASTMSNDELIRHLKNK